MQVFRPECHRTGGGTRLGDTGAVQQLQAEQREKPHQDLDALHACLAVATPVVLLGAIQPVCHIAAQVPTAQAAHLQRVEEHARRGQQGATCAPAETVKL